MSDFDLLFPIASTEAKSEPPLEAKGEDIPAQLASLIQTTDNNFNTVLKSLKQKEDEIRQTQNLVYVGFLILIVMVAGMMLDVYFEIWGDNGRPTVIQSNYEQNN